MSSREFPSLLCLLLHFLLSRCDLISLLRQHQHNECFYKSDPTFKFVSHCQTQLNAKPVTKQNCAPEFDDKMCAEPSLYVTVPQMLWASLMWNCQGPVMLHGAGIASTWVGFCHSLSTTTCVSLFELSNPLDMVRILSTLKLLNA